MKKGKKGIIAVIAAMLITLAGVAIRTIVRHPEYFDKPFSKTDVVTYQDVDYSISNMKTAAAFEENKSRDGYEYIIITIKIENHSDKNLDSNNDSWDLKGKSGILTKNFIPVYSSKLYQVIYPNESGEIDLVFEKKIDATPTELLYYKNTVSSRGPAFTYKLD